MENYRKIEKLIKYICKNRSSGSGVGYVWGKYEHPHNVRPKTIPLIKQVK